MSKSVTQWMKESLKPFVPTSEQSMAKARLQDVLSERDGVLDIETLSMDQIVNLAGNVKIRKWAENNQSFLPWLLDKDVTKHKIQAAKDMCVDKLISILNMDLEAKVLTAKDWIAAADKLLQLADAYPSKKKEITYLDREVANMSDEDVKKQLEAYKTKLLEK